MLNQVKREKIPDLLKRIKNCLDSGSYRFTKHALERKVERHIQLPDVLEVLYKGHHEKAKDSWNEQFESWDYAINGKTIDKDPCRIIVSFDNNGLLIITIIRLD